MNINNIKITFFSNFLLHHQTPFCNYMYNYLGDNFAFVSTYKIPDERLKLGYKDLNDSYSYVIKSYKNNAEYKKALSLGYESDIVIIGSAPDIFIKKRLKENKITFRYCERYFKKGRWRLFDPRVFIMHYKKDFVNRNKNLYMLCASSYQKKDCNLILSYPNKTYKWGYFPEVKKYNDINNIINNKKRLSLLWVGRLINWKHPEQAVLLVKRLIDNNYNVSLNIVGCGTMENYLNNLINKLNIQNYVNLLGAVSYENVRKYMEESEFFLFTSDQQEGWGAVLNEAMNSACAVIASEKIGSVPFLINNNENGLLYNGKINDLYIKTKNLLDNSELINKLGINAYKTICDKWNAEVATERFLLISENLLKNNKIYYIDGPCSKG